MVLEWLNLALISFSGVLGAITTIVVFFRKPISAFIQTTKDWAAVPYASLKPLQTSALDYYSCYGTSVGTNRINYRLYIPIDILPDNWTPTGVPGMRSWGYV